MKKILIPFVILFISLSSCKKDKIDYVAEYIGVYNAQRVGNSGSSFNLLIDKHYGDSILIQTSWIGEVKKFKAGVDIETGDFTIPSQAYNSNLTIYGYGKSENDKSISISYYISSNSPGSSDYKIIASK